METRSNFWSIIILKIRKFRIKLEKIKSSKITLDIISDVKAPVIDEPLFLTR